jgi:hypothetical protein
MVFCIKVFGIVEYLRMPAGCPFSLAKKLPATKFFSCTLFLSMAGACVGAGVDMITAADIRYCTADASFCVKEVDLAIVADMGSLQRLPGIVGQGSSHSG